jgi:hypothetical protein
MCFEWFVYVLHASRCCMRELSCIGLEEGKIEWLLDMVIWKPDCFWAGACQEIIVASIASQASSSQKSCYRPSQQTTRMTDRVQQDVS